MLVRTLSPPMHSTVPAPSTPVLKVAESCSGCEVWLTVPTGFSLQMTGSSEADNPPGCQSHAKSLLGYFGWHLSILGPSFMWLLERFFFLP